MKNLIVTLTLIMLTASVAFSQKKDGLKEYHAYQYEVSYDKYQKDLPKTIVQKAREERKAKKKENKPTPVEKALAKAEKIRNKDN